MCSTSLKYNLILLFEANSNKSFKSTLRSTNSPKRLVKQTPSIFYSRKKVLLPWKFSHKSDPLVRLLRLVRSISCLGTHPAIFRSFRLSKPTCFTQPFWFDFHEKNSLPPEQSSPKGRHYSPTSPVTRERRKKTEPGVGNCADIIDFSHLFTCQTKNGTKFAQRN